MGIEPGLVAINSATCLSTLTILYCRWL